MDNMLELGVALVVGVCLGYLLGKVGNSGSPEVAEPAAEPPVNWWQIRNTLTGTQLQILQYMEAKKTASITHLQEKFSFIPDRELYYRLEQICLMDFLDRGREDGEVSYSLNPNYSGTVEDDKTVILMQ